MDPTPAGSALTLGREAVEAGRDIPHDRAPPTGSHAPAVGRAVARPVEGVVDPLAQRPPHRADASDALLADVEELDDVLRGLRRGHESDALADGDLHRRAPVLEHALDDTDRHA